MFRLLFAALCLIFSMQAVAQYDGDDVYDPFADYSEFEEDSQEEADINFFRNGRFFNISLLMGGHMFTKGMAQNVDASPAPGIAMTYFFNLRLALQFSYAYSQHVLGPIPTGAANPTDPQTIEGNMGLTSISFDLKYYFNTANVTRGLADLNPYIIGGFSQNSRAFSYVDQTIVGKDDGAGLDLGVGIEIPVSRNEMFIGAQFTYTYVNFSTENMPYTNTPPIVYLDGDLMRLYVVFGFNFL
jgi:hypothetical protein